MLNNRWCPRCNVGYIAGKRIEFARLFETLDPHGHELDPNSLTCASCQSALRDDGFCASCGMGFLRGQAYFTRLTHSLAFGKAVESSTITACATCRSNFISGGWCEHCGRGFVGNIAITDRTQFETAAREFRTLLAALDRAQVCELCGCAMVVHRTFPTCKISYDVESSG